MNSVVGLAGGVRSEQCGGTSRRSVVELVGGVKSVVGLVGGVKSEQ